MAIRLDFVECTDEQTRVKEPEKKCRPTRKPKTLYRVRIYRRATSEDFPGATETLVANDESLAVSPRKALNNVRFKHGIQSQYYEYDYGRVTYDYTWKVENVETGEIDIDTTSQKERN